MEFSTETKQRVYDEIEPFFTRPGTSAFDVSQLPRFLKASPATAPISKALPADELEQRLQLAKRVLDKLREGVDNWQWSALNTSVFFALPYDKLIQMEEDMSSVSFWWIPEDFLRMCKFQCLTLQVNIGSLIYLHITVLQLGGPANIVGQINTADSVQVARNRSEVDKVNRFPYTFCFMSFLLQGLFHDSANLFVAVPLA